MAKLSALLEVAENEVGYIEKASNSNLDDKTANAGDKNYTKYGRDLVKWIGSPYGNGCAWCDMFADWCFVTAYGKDVAYEMLGGWSAYTPTSASYFQKKKQWHTSKPQAGDVIFFKNSTRICHVGIVYKVDSSKVYTIEGNTSSSSGVVANGGCVAKKSYNLDYAYIAGYGRPVYETETVVDKKNTAYHYGIDISANQGVIDFTKVREECDFVILRSTTKNGKADTMWDSYLRSCDMQDIKTMCYKYSYATTEQQAIDEGNSVINLLNGRKMTIWYDVENTDQINKIGKHGLTQVINAFAKTCRDAGYTVGIYCNLNWYNNYIDADVKSNFEFWIARYGKNTGGYDETYKPNKNELGWQYTSKGRVNGINGDVDKNVFYGELQGQESVFQRYKVRVTANKLNVRAGAGTNHAIKTVINKGTIYTVLDEQNGWGKISLGWISLKWVEKM